MFLRTLLALAIVVGGSLSLAASPAAAARRPVVERIEPTTAPVGAAIEIIGREFAEGVRVFLGGQELRVERRLPNRLTVRVPAGASGGPVTVRTHGGEATGPFLRVVAAPPPPRIDAVEPAAGAPGSEVVLRGENFSARTADNVVTLGGATVVVRSATPTDLRVIVPEGATSESFAVRVAQAGEARSPRFTVTAATAITRLEPARSHVGGRVAVLGAGFSGRAGDNRVFLGGRACVVERATETELTVRVPRGATTGPLLVDVRGAGRAESATPLVVQPLPVVLGVEPSAAPPGAIVTVRGAHFGEDPRAIEVRLGDAPVVLRTIADDAVGVEVPEGVAAGRFSVRVHGIGPGVAPGDFRVLAPTEIQAFEPRHGPVGTVVTLRGVGFSARPADNTVMLSGHRAQVVRASEGELKVRVPRAASGALELTVAGNGAARTSEPFLVTVPPLVSGFEPARGVPGDTIRIRGAAFGVDPALVEVSIDGRPLELLSVTEGELAVRIGPETPSGVLQVSVRLQGSARANRALEVMSPFRVDAIEPSRSFPGASISVRGDGLTEHVRVRFAGTRSDARVLAATGVEVRVVVPDRAQSGPITLALADGRSLPAPVSFEVLPVPEGTAILSVEAACAEAGCRAVLFGHGFARRPHRVQVWFGDTPVEVVRVTSTEIEIKLPGVVGTHPFRAVVRDRREAVGPAFTIGP